MLQNGKDDVDVIYIKKIYTCNEHQNKSEAKHSPRYKRWTVLLKTLKSAVKNADWVKWVHISTGESHCPTCLKLDGCWFAGDNKPKHPQHPYCHCELEPIPYDDVKEKATAYSDYRKFDPYLFDPDNRYKHGKQKMFESWGYSISDSEWLKQELEKQSLQKYILGQYTLGLLDKHGQRINIVVSLPRKKGDGIVSFVTGWMAKPNGNIQLNTPYGDK